MLCTFMFTFFDRSYHLNLVFLENWWLICAYIFISYVIDLVIRTSSISYSVLLKYASRHFTPQRNRRRVSIFTSACLCVCLSVKKIPAELIDRFFARYLLMAMALGCFIFWTFSLIKLYIIPTVLLHEQTIHANFHQNPKMFRPPPLPAGKFDR